MRRLALTAAALALASPAAAQNACGPHDIIMDLAKKTYDEVPVSMGRIGEQRMAELTLSPTGSWSLIVTTVQGVSCVVASGQDWQQGNAPKPGRDS